jgi:nicotinate-nucleotide adenylyltransferase
MLDFRKVTALYGGSFDPVHLGHLHIADEVARLKPEIQQIVFVPARISPGKPELTGSPEARLKFLTIALEGTRYKIWDFEIHRDGESYTVDTLEEAHNQGANRDRLFWIMGADAYENFASWQKSDRIRTLCTLLVVGRPGIEIRQQNSADQLLNITLNPISSSQVRDALKHGKVPQNTLPPLLERHLRDLLLKSQNPYAMH